MENRTNSSEPSRGRLLALGGLALLVVVVVVIIFVLQSQANDVPEAGQFTPVEPGAKIQDGMVIQLAEPCARFQKVLSDTPLVFSYGYWGFLPEYGQQNLENLMLEVYLDGELVDHAEDVFNLVPTTALPCADMAAYSSAFVDEGQWAYAEIDYPGLPRGEYVVEVVFYLRERVATGQVDETGELLYVGPGEVYRFTKELLVE